MKLTGIEKISGTLELLTGLHIGGGNTEMHIGGTDNPVIKNPVNDQPYIPGSSIKGKMRSLLEWELGVVSVTNGAPLGFEHLDKLSGDQLAGAKSLLSLFGGAPKPGLPNDLLAEVGPTRLAFWDCSLDQGWVEEMEDRHLLFTEVKMENSIDRIKGTAENPRNTERVPAGAKFEFNVSVRIHDNEDLLDTLFRGLRLLEITGLGGSGSRGYGKIKITLSDDSQYQERMQNLALNMAT